MFGVQDEADPALGVVARLIREFPQLPIDVPAQGTLADDLIDAASVAPFFAVDAPLHGLLAYEKRIADVQEWPFDQWTLIRVSAYILIPAVPSIGQFFVKFFMERFAQ